LARIEKTAAARRPAGPDRPDLVVVAVDGGGVARFYSVVGPYQGCAGRGWPQNAYEPFAGDEADLEACYARHDWQPARTIVLCADGGEALFRIEADHAT
jgi:hypothetical protein